MNNPIEGWAKSPVQKRRCTQPINPWKGGLPSSAIRNTQIEMKCQIPTRLAKIKVGKDAEPWDLSNIAGGSVNGSLWENVANRMIQQFRFQVHPQRNSNCVCQEVGTEVCSHLAYHPQKEPWKPPRGPPTGERREERWRATVLRRWRDYSRAQHRICQTWCRATGQLSVEHAAWFHEHERVKNRSSEMAAFRKPTRLKLYRKARTDKCKVQTLPPRRRRGMCEWAPGASTWAGLGCIVGVCCYFSNRI